MNRLWPLLNVLVISVGICFGQATVAQDLNIPAAQARYEQKRQRADQAKRIFDQEDSAHKNLEYRLSDAQRGESYAEQSLQAARSTLQGIGRDISQKESEVARLELEREQLSRQRLDAASDLSSYRRRVDELSLQRDERQQDVRTIERRIADLENNPRQGAWTCCYVDSGWEEHSGGHCSTDRSRVSAESSAERMCRSSHSSCRLDRCEQPDDAQLANLRRQLETARSDLRDFENRLYTAQQNLRTQEQKIRDLDYKISQAESSMTDSRTQLSQLRSRRLDAQSQVTYEERQLSDAQSKTRAAQSQLDYHTPTLEASRREWQAQESEAQIAYDDLQQVIANYNRALNGVYARADSDATEHSGREAQERAPSSAESLGQRDAKISGEEKGSAEGGARDFSRGYKIGRESGSSNSRLLPIYQQGLRSGELAADDKAQKEDFPLGYNSALDQILGVAPEKVATIDITEQTSSDPGDNGADIDPRKKAIGNIPAPVFSFPQEPAYNVPRPGNPSYGSPAADYRFRAYPCTGLQLPEFEPKCRERYDNTYAKQFSQQYAMTFARSYTDSFNNAVRSFYDAALNKTYDGSRARGEEQGAKDQGTLDGFSASISQARARHYQLGQTAVNNLLGTGHLIIVRDVSLIEESGDGLFASGDRAKLRIVFDNYGHRASPLGKIRVRVTGKTNSDTLTFEIRELPALAANTRTTFEGVVAAKISRAKAQSKVALKGFIEVKGADGAYTELEAIHPEAEIRFPLEVQTLTLSRKPKVNEEVPAVVRVTNLTKETLGAKQLFFASDPATVAFTGSPVVTPELSPGQSADLRVNVKPGVWVADDIPVNILSTTKDSGGVVESTQVFPQIINVERNAVLALKDQSGQPVTTGIIDAVAGQTVYFKIQFNFLATSRQPGPFMVRYTQTSDPGIRPANNSTTSVNYGSWGPGATALPVTFAFDIPQSLRGKSGYIMIQLNDGAVATHALQVGLRIQ